MLIPFFPSTPSGSVHPDDIEETPMLVELRPGNYQATLYMKNGDRITTTTGGDDTPSPAEQTGKFPSFI